MTPEIPDDAPAWSDLEREECHTALANGGLYVQYDGWEYYLREENGPCRPSMDLDGPYTMLRFYDDRAVVIHDPPEQDRDWEIGFRLCNVYQP